MASAFRLALANIALLLASSAILPVSAATAKFLGPEPCELCHKEIAKAQEQTAMANTWQETTTSWLPSFFNATVADDLEYQIKRVDDSITYSVDLGSGRKVSLPVSLLMGGRRHGLGFLSPVQDVDGIPLARPVLVQARYAWSQENHKLLPAPGCVNKNPASLEAALGVVLSPTFEARCLACHGEPNKAGVGKLGGVHCESCHGPGSEHLAGIAQGRPANGIQNTRKLSNDESISICASCHVGLTKFSDPSPNDLLIANQVQAIRQSECYLQSGQAFSCTACHDPHNDAIDDKKAVNTCLGCHSRAVSRHAAICPVNSTGACVGCHMPSVDQGPLHLVDHSIRVHPEAKTAIPRPDIADISLVTPQSEFLRIIVTDSEAKAAAAQARITRSDDFYTVARELSLDPSAAIGGYLGRRKIVDLPKEWRDPASHLRYGQTSIIFQVGSRWILLQRLPRDFRQHAEQLEQQADELARTGDAAGAIRKAQDALMVYPQFLRALVLIGSTFTQSGNPGKGVQVLTVAAHLYPEDAGVEFAVAASLDAAGDMLEARKAYQRVVELEPDFTAAYVSLGMNYYASGDWPSAALEFQKGLLIDPLSAELNYDLSLALVKSGQETAAHQARALAEKLDALLVRQREPSH